MNQAQQVSEGFKQCPCCGEAWTTREDFLGSPSVQIVGYQVNPKYLKSGLFLFNHLTCGTTMAIEVRPFADLYDGPVFEENLRGTSECPEHCLYKDDLQRCPAKCECAYVREIIQIIKNWPVGVQSLERV